MSFVTHKARKRLEWQDRPKGVQQREAYKIAAKHEPSMSRALNRYFKELRSPDAMRAFTRALSTATTPAQAVEALPFEAAGERLREAIARVMANIVEESGRAEGRRGVEVPEPVLKARVSFSFTLDNPYSLRRIEKESAELVVEVTRSIKDAIRVAVEKGFAEGKGADAIARDVRDTNIGLTSRDAAAVERHAQLTFVAERKAGATLQQAIAVARKAAMVKHEQLLKRRVQNIARTETMRAQNDGLMDSWRKAQDDGLIAPQARKVWIASVPRVNERMCQVCEELGTTYGPDSGGIPLDEPFVSAVNGQSYDRPIAHPSCFPAGTMVVANGIVAVSVRTSMGRLYTVETTSGRVLRCTPNHPIMTPGGFVPAHALVPGVSVVAMDAPLQGFNLGDTVVDAIDKIAPPGNEYVKQSKFVDAEAFHGEGVSSVDVVITGKRGAYGKRRRAMAQEPHFAAFLLSQRKTSVSADMVVSVESELFTGPVYNLETVSGYYVAEGVVVSNCRCTMGLITTIEGGEG